MPRSIPTWATDPTWIDLSSKAIKLLGRLKKGEITVDEFLDAMIQLETQLLPGQGWNFSFLRKEDQV